MPDVSLGIRYDRYGGVWKDFYGVGVGMQIPLFNRNKGAIKTARIQLRQNETLVEQEQTGWKVSKITPRPTNSLKTT